MVFIGQTAGGSPKVNLKGQELGLDYSVLCLQPDQADRVLT